MTPKVLKLTLFVFGGILTLYYLQEPTIVSTVQNSIVYWNWSIDRILNFSVYHPLAFAFIPLAIIILLASK